MTFWLDRLLETATYWAPTATPTHSGAVQFASPVPVAVRWEDRAERFVDAQGRERISRAVVTVDREVAPDGRLLKGTSAAADPTTVVDTFPILGVDSVPRLRAPSEREITAFL